MASWLDPAGAEVAKEWAAKNPNVGMPAVTMVVAIAQKHGGYLYDGTPEADAFNKTPQFYKDEGVKGVIPAPSGYNKLPLNPPKGLTPEELATLTSDCARAKGTWNPTTNTCLTPSRYGGNIANGFVACRKKGGSFMQTGPTSGLCYPAGATLPSDFKPYTPPPVAPKSPGAGIVSMSDSGSNTVLYVGGALLVLGGLGYWYMKRRAGSATPAPAMAMAGAPRSRKRRSKK